MNKIKDRIVLGLLVGFLSNIPKLIINDFFYRHDIVSKRYGDIVAGLFLTNIEAKKKKGALFGTMGDFIIASMLGVPLVYVLSYTGKDKSWLKGILVGIFGFGVFRGIMSKLGNFLSYPKDVQTNTLMTLSSLIWGITAGLAAPKLGVDKLFKPKPVVLSNPEEENK